MSNLHGGAASLIFDVCTTCALVPYARRGFWQFAGVTRSLNVSYLRPAKLGQKVEVRCEVVSIGKRLATVRGEIWGEVEGDKGKEVEGGQKRLMVCEHLKVGIDPPVRGEGAKL
ncbi:HotDog domain-containing protein [Tricharina praecox]|uniref:HotDog domain-containing protein n=1 Tax=Tricharina praecox TaxID=43433 RepID=UPI0022204BB8|nr:HotDog domain-containing protein [Tricharina praecox]KAI5848800.1 HotDog domain-containing protein [Tricharina praecox]